MAHTFLYATENDGKPTTLRFKSYTPKTYEFEVTVLSDPALEPFTITLDRGQWKMPNHLPEPIRTLEQTVLEAAEKFKRQ